MSLFFNLHVFFARGGGVRKYSYFVRALLEIFEFTLHRFKKWNFK